jgi:hypothetical protein
METPINLQQRTIQKKKKAIVPKLGRVGGWFYFKLNVMESWSRSLFTVATVIESDELRIVGGRIH